MSGLSLGVCSAMVVSLVDAAEISLRVRFPTAEARLLLAAVLLSTLLVMGAILGALGGVFAEVARTLADRSRFELARSRGTPALLALLLAAPSIWIELEWLQADWLRLRPLERGTAIALGPIGTVALAFAATRLLLLKPWTAYSRPLRSAVAGAAASCSAALFVVDRSLSVESYWEAHALLSIHAVLAAVVAVQWAGRAFVRKSEDARVFVATACFSLALLSALEASDAQPPAAIDSLVYGKLVRPLRRLSDFDADGASSLFAGRDCRAFEARFAPTNADLPGDGLDQDCSGADASRPDPKSEREPFRRAPEPRRYNVLWIGIDALRADHVGAYGYERRTTPHLDRLAASAFRFERAYAQATGTWDSVPSMLTGIYPHGLFRDYEHPSALRGKRWYSYLLRPESPMLSDRLAAHGYQTAGFASFRVFDWLGFDRRFRTYERTFDHEAKGRAFIAAAAEPFLLWHHLPYPHEPYEHQPGFDFGDGPIDRYDGEIARADAVVGALLDALERRGVSERTVVVVTADHGEAFGEHGRKFHGRSCYDEQIRVPLVVRVPGLPEAVVAGPVELVDLVPTLIELVGAPFETTDFDGRSLLGAAEPNASGQARAYCEFVERDRVTLKALITRDWKLVIDHRRDRLELYDLVRDPRELVNVVEEQPTVREQLLGDFAPTLAAAARRR